MYSKVIKCVSVAALALAAAVALKGIPQILLQFAVCGGALFVMIEAVRNAKYLWAMAFAIPAAL